MGTSGPDLALAVVTGLGPGAAGGHRAPAAAVGPGPVVEPQRAGGALAGPDQIPVPGGEQLGRGLGGRDQQLPGRLPGPALTDHGPPVAVGADPRGPVIGGHEALAVTP